MKKWALGLVILASTMSPAYALLGGANATGDTSIRINGHPYAGTWTYFEDRVYVNVDSLSKALGLPHQHNALNWQVSESNGKGNPFVLSAESGGVKIPAVRIAGATMVDLEKAARALKLHFHRDPDAGVIEVGAPYRSEYVVGGFYRKYNLRAGSYQGTTDGNVYQNDDRSYTKWGHKRGK